MDEHRSDRYKPVHAAVVYPAAVRGHRVPILVNVAYAQSALSCSSISVASRDEGARKHDVPFALKPSVLAPFSHRSSSEVMDLTAVMRSLAQRK